MKRDSGNYLTMRVLLIGAVESTERTLLKLIEHKLNLVGVMGYQPKDIDRVSGYVDLSSIANSNSIPFLSFRNINDHYEDVVNFEPDIIFVVGLSQLISEKIISLPQYGCVGFHPTHLPSGRGRAPIAWLVLEQQSGAANFFRIGDGVDDGPIYVQQPFQISEQDDAGSVCEKLFEAMDIALDHWLPKLSSGDLSCVKQNDSKATWFARRTPEDGVLDWQKSADDSVRLIRASSRPHPGAFTFCSDSRIIVWQAHSCNELAIKGVIGRIVLIEDPNSFVVQCGTGLLRVTEYSVADNQIWQPKVGLKLGYDAEAEIFQLRKRLNDLTASIETHTKPS